MGTVYNAIASHKFKFHPKPQNPAYLAFLGRMSPEKGPHLAIRIAKQTGQPLKARFNQDFWLPDQGYYALP